MPDVHVVPKGSLVAKDVPLVTDEGDTVADAGVHKLCRCGRSREKPFCDDTHKTFDWQDGKVDGRTPRKVESYEGKQITIEDDRGICSHAGYCTDLLANVWKSGEEPWIDPDGAPPKEIADVIRKCPSGALSYILEGKQHDSFHDVAEIEVAPAGPFRVRGGPVLRDPSGDEPRSKEHYALCRCGASKNKPFCDGTHWYVNFGHKGPATTAETETDGYVDIGPADAFEEGKPVEVDAGGVKLAVFMLWGRVCAVGTEHEGQSLLDAKLEGGKLVAGEKRYTPYPWARADGDDAPVHDVIVIDGTAWASEQPV